MIQHGAQIGFRKTQNAAIAPGRTEHTGQAETLRAKFYLRGRFFTADVNDARALVRERAGDLQQQGGFARSGRSADQRQAPRNDPAAQNAVELRQVRPHARKTFVVDAIERHGQNIRTRARSR